MRALLIEATPTGPRIRFTTDHPDPQPAPGEVAVDVQLAGVCSTDLELAAGYMGFAGIPGHEFVGIVRAPGHALDGRRVVAEINVPPPGFAGDLEARKHAPRRTVLGILGRDGAFAERITLPPACLLPVPDDLPDERAVFAEPVAAALQILDDCTLAEVTRAGVIGAGRLGLLCGQVLASHCPRTDMLVRRSAQADVCRQLGLPALAAEEIGHERPYDLLVDCTGNPDGLAWCLRHVRPRGQIVLKSTYATPRALDLAPIVIDEIRVLGSRCGPMDAALEALHAGTVAVDPLVTARFPLAEAEQALAAARKPEHIKVLLDCGGRSC